MRLGSPASKSKLRIRLAPFDLLWALVAPVLALALRDPGLLDFGDEPYTLRPAYEYALVTTAMAAPAFLMFRVGEGMNRFFSVRDALSVCAAVAVAIGSSSLLLFVFTRLEGVPRSTPLICGLVMVAGMIFARMAARLLHSEEWAAASEAPPTPAHDVRRVLLIGVDRFAAIAIKLIDSQRPRTTQIVAALDTRPDYVGRTVGSVKVVGGVDDFAAVIEEYAIHGVDIDEVWYSDEAPARPSEALARLQEQCLTHNVRFVRLADALGLSAPRMSVHPTPRSVVTGPQATDYFRLKRVLDLVAASALLVVFLPLMIVVACLTLFDVGAPVLFWQQRVGMHGRRFLLYKFRTYQAPFDNIGLRVPDALRLSRIGRLIRAIRMDELPQLMNVLVGDMSLIGPRPLLPQDQPVDPSTRLTVRPGITGWAQINGGAIITPEEKDALDAWYVRHASFALDCRILALTLRFLLTGEKVNASAVQQALSFREEAQRPKAQIVSLASVQASRGEDSLLRVHAAPLRSRASK